MLVLMKAVEVPIMVITRRPAFMGDRVDPQLLADNGFFLVVFPAIDLMMWVDSRLPYFESKFGMSVADLKVGDILVFDPNSPTDLQL